MAAIEDLGALPTTRSPPSARHHHHLVLRCVEADVVARDVVVNDEVDGLRSELRSRTVEALARRGRPRSRRAPGHSPAAARARQEHPAWARAPPTSRRRLSSACLQWRRTVGSRRLRPPSTPRPTRPGEVPPPRASRRSRSRRRSRRGGGCTERFAASSVTSAPRRRASSASATPMRPEDRLPR